MSGGGGGGGVQAPQLILQFKEWVQWFYYTFSRGSNFFQGGGVQMLISIETHITITCDFPGEPGPPIPPLWISPWTMWHFGGLLLSFETPNSNKSIVFKRLAKALIRLRICACWSKPLVLAHTTLFEISYCGPFIGAKNALRLYYSYISGRNCICLIKNLSLIS